MQPWTPSYPALQGPPFLRAPPLNHRGGCGAESCGPRGRRKHGACSRARGGAGPGGRVEAWCGA
eukprot:2210064-Pyramimonas_sp.AAC.1